MRTELAQAVLSDSGTLLYSAPTRASSEGFDKSPYSGPSNTPQKAPCSLPFWLVLLLNSVLTRIQNQERSSRVREEPRKIAGTVLEEFHLVSQKGSERFAGRHEKGSLGGGGHRVMWGRRGEGKGMQKEGEEDTGWTERRLSNTETLQGGENPVLFVSRSIQRSLRMKGKGCALRQRELRRCENSSCAGVG